MPFLRHSSDTVHAKTFTTSLESCNCINGAGPMAEYTHSPKIIIITGPRAAGKTTVAKQLVEELGYHHIWLDGINGKVRKELNLETNDMYAYTPENQKAYERHIRKEIKGIRYKNLVFEGDAVRSPYILDTFINMVVNYYGEYSIFKAFSLTPDQTDHRNQYMLREIQRVKGYIKNNLGKPREEHVGDKRIRDYDQNEIPDPAGFERVEDAEAIMQWARNNRDARHQSLPEKYADLIKCVADSDTYTPFYQTVDVDGLRIIGGIFNSNLSWKNIMTLRPDFKDKSVADLGAMHGYFSFKVEECGAREVVGLEINPSSVEVAEAIAISRKSRCTFEICDVDTDELPKCDVYLAMNMLHWVKDLDAFLDKLTDAADEIIMEVGETQIKQITRALWPKGFKPVSIQESHRPDQLIGQRQLFHFVCTDPAKKALVKKTRQAQQQAHKV